VTFKSGQHDPAARPVPARAGTRRRYEKPRLVDYGAVSKLTQTGGVTTPDNMSMQQRCL
jgi:hypothetical protein